MVAKTYSSAPKAAIGVALASAMLLSANPAAAREGNGIGAGEVIAGVAVLGGLAAILSSDKGNDANNAYYDRADRRYPSSGYDYRRNDDSRGAVNQCVRAVERDGARRYGRVDVRQVSSVDRKRNGYRIKGHVVQEERRGYGRNRFDAGKFTCDVSYGRIQNVKITGLRR